MTSVLKSARTPMDGFQMFVWPVNIYFQGGVLFILKKIYKYSISQSSFIALLSLKLDGIVSLVRIIIIYIPNTEVPNINRHRKLIYYRVRCFRLSIKPNTIAIQSPNRLTAILKECLQNHIITLRQYFFCVIQSILC